MSDDSDWIDELYAEGPDELPPAALDERIRANARKELNHPWYRSPGRLASLATAASLVLAAMIIYYIPEEPLAPEADALMQPASVRKAEPAGDMSALQRTNDQAPMEAKRSQPGRPAAPEAEAILEEIAMEPDPEKAAFSEVRAQEPAAAPPPAMKKAERNRVVADQQTGLSSNAPAAAAGTRQLAADMDTLAVTETESTLGSLATAAPVEIEAQLAELCGRLPGTPETRSIDKDALGWYLTVSVGDDDGYWRCQDGAWIEIESPALEARSEEQ